ncbi:MULTISPECIES: hypothetical protein [Providencia]|uniref:Phage protein n=2 Tax=Morganellaceae TaxID=1903414 RepID=A0AAX3RWH7_9GAMM|nr:hypothetical protein [Providencia vermicola]EMD5257126.1 hypothetical protein [Providencia stuartii]USB37114.1 hypothetical protein M5J11_00920 [Providencia vermicola]WFC06046.1 hypothetical protein PG365_15265 [Providencia vermicola]
MMNKSRQQFEEWFTPQKEEMKNNGLGMISITRMHQRQLSAWQASRESLEVELPELDSHYNDYFLDGFNSAIEQVEKALISNGVKIKNE